jgi:integrase
MRATVNYMPREQFDQVLSYIPNLHIRKWKDQDIQMLFKLCYWCALRIGEALRLKAEDFDLELAKLYLGNTKTNLNDDTAIPRYFIHELELWLDDKQGVLFPGLTYGTCIKWIQRIGKELDILAWNTLQQDTGEKTKSHIFRKTVGKDLLYGTYGQKAPLPTISKTLRHKGRNPLTSTVHYLKASSDDVGNYWDEVYLNSLKK